ncbi:hypothetical protein [Flavobacterium foetidum]|uniref:hypothetical protein n=1 Tax=Flavobacterium foetidum TaxID=2026681 RepID=UPI0010752164|nr:hypothetical protein [Flavobacterium foetidum]KAF2516681.1 hypothetical protein E0W73_06215 [Flavobacterium foetidum]
MKQKDLNVTAKYEAAIYTSDVLKIEFILNKVIHDPDSVILVEPGKNEYYLFYTGTASIPEESVDFKSFKAESSEVKKIDLPKESSTTRDRWTSEVVTIQRGEFFFTDICNAINKIRNKNSIRIAVEQGEDVNRKLYFYYKR